MSRKKKAKSFVHVEMEVSEDGHAYRLSCWTEDGSPMGMQELMDAVSDSILIEFGVVHIAPDPDEDLPH